MPTTSLTSPLSLQPAYNPNIFTFTSTTNTNTGFRYLVDVYSGSTGTSSIIGRFKITPTQYGDGYIDLSRILQNYVSYTFDQTSTVSANTSNNFLDYNVKLGEEYLYQFAFTKIVESASGKVILSGASTPAFIVGDQINVSVAVDDNTGTINGLHTVQSAMTNAVMIEVFFPDGVTSPMLSAGTLTYSDNRKIQFTGQTSLTGKTVVNTAVDWPEWKNWTTSQYEFNFVVSNTKKLLSSLSPYASTDSSTRRVLITPQQTFHLQFFADSATDQYGLTWTHFRANDTSVSSSTVNLSTGYKMKMFKVGLTALGISASNLQIGDYLEFYITKTAGTVRCSDKYRFYFDLKCQNDSYVIYFMDRKGSILSMPFYRRGKETITIDREIQKQVITYGLPSALDLSLQGTSVTNVDIVRQFDLQSDWMTDKMLELMEELTTSRYTWLDDGTNVVPCVVQDKSYELTKQKNKVLQRKTVTVQLSNQQPTN